MDDFIGRLTSWTTALWTFVAINAVALFRAWPAIMGRVNERARDSAAEKASDWSRLRDEIGRLSNRVKDLEDRCERYEADLIECHRERDEAIAAKLRAEAILQGRGEVRQEVQLLDSKRALGGVKDGS